MALLDGIYQHKGRHFLHLNHSGLLTQAVLLHNSIEYGRLIFPIYDHICDPSLPSILQAIGII